MRYLLFLLILILAFNAYAIPPSPPSTSSCTGDFCTASAPLAVASGGTGAANLNALVKTAETIVTLATSATPALTAGASVYVTNGSITKITNITGGTAGRKIFVLCADATTPWTGSNATMFINGGVDYTCVIGQWVWGIHDGTMWNLGVVSGTSYGLDTDLSSVSASDDSLPSAKATKAMGDLKLVAAESYTALAASTTPALTAGVRHYKTANATVRTITALTGAAEGWDIVIRVDHADQTWQCSSGFTCNAGVNYTSSVGDIIRGHYSGSAWTLTVTPNETVVKLTSTLTVGQMPKADADGNLVAATAGTDYMKEATASGGLLFGDSTPDAAGEVGYDSGKFSFYGANSEDIYIEPGNAGNTAVIGSNTGVTRINSALAIVTTGIVAGKIPINSKGAAYTVGTDDAAEAYGGMIYVTAAATITLPSVVIGMSVCVYSVIADVVRLNPADADGIRLNGGTRSADGVDMYSAGATGDFLCVIGDSADGWTTAGRSGTWTVGT